MKNHELKLTLMRNVSMLTQVAMKFERLSEPETACDLSYQSIEVTIRKPRHLAFGKPNFSRPASVKRFEFQV